MGDADNALLLGEVFDHLPYGVVVADRAGTVLTSNPAARTLLGRLLEVTARRALQTCARERANRLDAASGDDEPPEVRIDLPPDSPAEAAWVTLASLTDDRVLLHVRRGRRHDRRRRVDTSWMDASTLEISVLRRMRVVSPNGPLGGSWIDQRPGQLLRYLVCRRAELVHPEEIAHALWPSSGASGVNTVRYYLHSLRSQLEPGRPKRAESSFISTRGGGYQLDLDRVKVDADAFEAGVASGQEAMARGDEAGAARELAAAVDLYRADLMPEERFAEWALRERQRLRRLAHVALSGLLELKLEAGDLDGAAAYLERLADFDPLDADVQRRLIELCVQRGRRSEAARHYESYRLLLLREFDELPEFTLADVVRSSRLAVPSLD